MHGRHRWVPEWAPDHAAEDKPGIQETGRWSTSGDRWVPYPRVPDESGFSIERFEDTGELWGPNRRPPGLGHVLDNHDWYEQEPPPYDPVHPFYQRLRYAEEQANGRYPHPQLAPREPRRLPTGPPQRPGPGRELAPRNVPRRAAGRPDTRSDWDEFDEPTSGGQFLVAAFATIFWYVLPVSGYLGWAFLLSDSASATCVDDLGMPCVAPRTEAVRHLVENLPELGIAASISLTLALLLRWIASGWHALAVGFAASVVGASVATVLFSTLGIL